MLKPILIHPDPRLRKSCAAVGTFGEPLARLGEDMLGTMYAAPGLGLAAPQIGVLDRVFVMDCAKEDDGEAPEPMIFVNPEIVASADETREHEEGCLSLPGVYVPITRPAAVRVRWQDVEGQSQEADFEGLRATCVQHEIDHLDGKLFIDYIPATRRAMLTQKMKRLRRDIARDPSLYPYGTPLPVRTG